MKKLICLLALLLFVQNNIFADIVYDDNYQESPNYIQGKQFYENSQYSSAITEFKKALRYNPKDTSSLIGFQKRF